MRTLSPTSTNNSWILAPSAEEGPDNLITSPWGSIRPKAVTDFTATGVAVGLGVGAVNWSGIISGYLNRPNTARVNVETLRIPTH